MVGFKQIPLLCHDLTHLLRTYKPFWLVLRYQLEVPEQGHCSGKICGVGERADSGQGLAIRRDEF